MSTSEFTSQAPAGYGGGGSGASGGGGGGGPERNNCGSPRGHWTTPSVQTRTVTRRHSAAEARGVRWAAPDDPGHPSDRPSGRGDDGDAPLQSSERRRLCRAQTPRLVLGCTVPCRAVYCRAVSCRALPYHAAPCRAEPSHAVTCRGSFTGCLTGPCRTVP